MTALYKNIFVAAGLAVAAFSSAGVLLAPGGAALLPVEEHVDWTLVDTKARTFSITNAALEVRATGTAYSQIVRENATGTLTFYYLVQNDATSLDEINRVTVTGFAGWQTTVSQDDTTVFSSARRFTSSNRSVSGDVMGASFLGSPLGNGFLAPGESSAIFVVRTNARDYTHSTLNVIDGGIASVESFAPVPEPGTMAALGLGALVALRRRKKA